MPQHRVLHEADAFACHRVRDDAGGTILLDRQDRQRCLDLLEIVSVDLDDVPSERAPFIGERLELHHVRDCVETLNFVVVDQDDEIVELVLRREERRLPDRTFIAFAVAEHHEHAMRFAVELRGERHAGGDRKSVPEGTGRQLDTGDGRRCVSGQSGAVRVPY